MCKYKPLLMWSFFKGQKSRLISLNIIHIHIKMPRNSRLKTQKNTLHNYMKPHLRQEIFLNQLEEAFKEAEKQSEIDFGLVNDVVHGEELDAVKEKNKKLSKENKKLIKDNKLLKKLFDEVKNLIFQKDLKIKKLQAKLPMKKSVNLFEKSEHYFSSAGIKNLRSLRNGERNDSTFVTNCMLYLHGGKENLSKRVVTASRVPNGKKVISPDKSEIVERMLEERLNSEGNSSEAVLLRSNRLRKLLNNAISTANRKTASDIHGQSTHEIAENTAVNTTSLIENQALNAPPLQRCKKFRNYIDHIVMLCCIDLDLICNEFLSIRYQIRSTVQHEYAITTKPFLDASTSITSITKIISVSNVSASQ